MITTSDPAVKERLDSERNQGRAPDMDWLDHDRLGFNYRLSDLACAIGVAQLEKLDRMLERRARVAALYSERLDGVEGLETPSPGAGAERRGWFVYVVRVPRGGERDAVVDRLAEAGIASKPYMPCVHLFPHLRELGYREGQFPVAEDAAVRSLALPFFNTISEGQVERVCEALVAALGR